jgi:regulator of sirC expression with transglutaminase-like and TPR domain
MKLQLPICCTPAAFSLLSSQLSNLESPAALLRGAIAVANHQLDDVNVERIESTLDGYAREIRSRVRGSQEQAILAHLHEYLFEELGFRGNVEDYYNPLNSCLPVVIENKRGLPIILSMIYVLVAQRLGLDAWGIGLPGHFLAGVRTGDTVMLVDPFEGGRIVTAEESHERLKLLLGAEQEWSEDYLEPLSSRQWLTRMIQNLLMVFTQSSRYPDAAAMLEMEIVLWPEQSMLERDLALVLARCGLSSPALKLLNEYIQTNPDDPQRPQLQQLAEVLGK